MTMIHPKELLRQYGLEAKKSLGQNFLFDENVLRRIVAAAELQPGDAVLEIGPGLGALTKLLAATAVSLVAVELDQRFLPILRQQLAPYANVQLVHGDILAQQPRHWFSGPYKVVANVPYYITGAILRHLLEGEHKPSLLVLTVQKEVAERVTAVPPNMSLLAVSVQFYGHAEKVTDIKAGSFWPAPDVDSAVLRITLPPTPPDRAFEQAFFRVTRAGFSQKRKQLQNNLRQLGLPAPAIAAMCQSAAVDGRWRAEMLTLPQWCALAHAYLAQPN